MYTYAWYQHFIMMVFPQIVLETMMAVSFTMPFLSYHS